MELSDLQIRKWKNQDKWDDQKFLLIVYEFVCFNKFFTDLF
ncbi:hypothetical protein LAV73_09360 [Lysinibacillus xylanilyticus]|nr:hypothetical protein [Lysinibacillus xylanilyticus]